MNALEKKLAEIYAAMDEVEVLKSRGWNTEKANAKFHRLYAEYDAMVVYANAREW